MSCVFRRSPYHLIVQRADWVERVERKCQSARDRVRRRVHVIQPTDGLCPLFDFAQEFFTPFTATVYASRVHLQKRHLARPTGWKRDPELFAEFFELRAWPFGIRFLEFLELF